MSEKMRADRPRQAVILAGGLGTRLLPLTLSRPKPMIELNGKPFLEYLVLQLRDQGFDRILLLLGYLPDSVVEHFGDGSRFGVSIEYSISSAENLTGTRLRLAKARLDELFLLLYCDNYWPLSFAKMWAAYEACRAPAMITVYRNTDGYTRDNLAVGEGGIVTKYDRTRTEAGLRGVDIGYALITRALVDQLQDENVSFEGTVYPQLVATGGLMAYVTDHRYYSVGSLERLETTRQFLERRPTIILDRDGVLNRKPPRAQYVRSWAEFEWLSGAREALGLLGSAGYRVIVVSNQAGIARGAMTREDVEDINSRMSQDALAAGCPIETVLYCPHDWNEGCDCRKPRPGMLFEAQRRYGLDLSRIHFIGDDDRDAQAAEAAGCLPVLVSDHRPLLDVVRSLLNTSSGVS